MTWGQFWFGYGAVALWMFLRASVNKDLVSSVPWPDRALVLLLSTVFWPVEFIGWLHYLYTKFKRKAAK